MADWIYYQLYDRQDRMIGFMRECNGKKQFAELCGRSWLWQPIPYGDRIRIDSPDSLRGLGRCR
jgi:hypothetical protein